MIFLLKLIISHKYIPRSLFMSTSLLILLSTSISTALSLSTNSRPRVLLIIHLHAQQKINLQTFKYIYTTPYMTSANKLDWPEPIVRVQSVSNTCASTIPDRYIKPPTERPCSTINDVNIPLIDLSGNSTSTTSIGEQVSIACRDWGFFQVINHGVSHELMDRMREIWREFFHLPMEVKQGYANDPSTYEGYGSRLGVQKGAVLDWSDYYFLHYLPAALKDHKKWPALPSSCREVIDEYAQELVKLGGKLMTILSANLGLEEETLQNAFGGEDFAACLRVNFYPKCPQPELALGLSSHSDPGGMTLLLPDQDVAGLQVRRHDSWITVKPVKHAFIVNIGDQIQVVSNAIYKSVEHRVIVNSMQERVSLAFFYNPRSDIPIEPAKELVSPENPPLYEPMTYNEYRLFIRLNGPKGKSQVESLKSPRCS